MAAAGAELKHSTLPRHWRFGDKSMTQRTGVRLAISMVVFVLFLGQAAGWYGHTLLDQLESFSYDARLLLTMPRTVDKRIVIVDMDEKSLASEGWPWPRAKFAGLVRQLFEHYGVRVVGFDIDFQESDPVSGTQVLQDLATGQLADLPGFAQRVPELVQRLDGDRAFAEAIRGKPVVLGMFLKQFVPQGETANTGALCAPVIDAAARRLLEVNFAVNKGYGGNIATLQDATAYCGFFDNPGVDDDGLFRHVPLLQEFGGQIYPSLPVAVTQAALGNAPVSLEFDPPDIKTSLSLERVRVGQVAAPVDGQAAIYVPYRGAQFSFPYVSAADVLHGTADPAVLKGAVVLVGTTAAGLLDYRSTPMSKIFPGVEVHANIISGLLDGRIKQKAPYFVGIEAVLELLIAALMALVYPRLSPLLGSLLVAAIIAVLLALGFGFWTGANFIMPLGVPVVFTVTLFLAHTFNGLVLESRRARDTAKKFGQYVDPVLVKEMAESDQEVSMETQRREMTVLFADVRGFTTISEKYSDNPKELSELMNHFLSALTEVVFRHRGTIDKYMGDAVMAFWGAPLEDSSHSFHALQAAVEFPQAIRRLDPTFEARGWPKLHIGVGLNSGSMTVGNMGSAFRVAYTVMGDAVNLGSRLEGLTKEYGVEVLCSEAVRASAPDWTFRELDLVKVKGKNEPVMIYEPLGPKEGIDEGLRKDLLRLRQALRAYRAQRWDEAEREFFGLSRSGRAHPLYELYLERIAERRLNPPPADWDGATVFKTK
jgi:adenylate cyclase